MNEHIKREDATHFRVFEDYDGYAIDAADDSGNYSEEIWTHCDDKPLTKEMAIGMVGEFAAYYCREDIADRVKVSGVWLEKKRGLWERIATLIGVRK